MPSLGDRRSRYFRALVERSNEITVVVGTTGNLEYVSGAVERILGYPPTWKRISDAFALVHPDDVDRVLADFRAKVADPAVGQPITFRMRHHSGAWCHVEAVGANLCDDPDVAAIVVNLRDVTARVEAEQQRDRSEAHYRRALDASPEAIAIHQDGAVVYANTAAACVLGAPSADDLVGRSVLEFIPPELAASIDARMRRVIAGAEVELAEEQLRRFDGRVVDVEVAAVPVEWNGRPAAQVVARDLTERNRARRDLQRQATHDPLTGLPNRVLLDARLAAAHVDFERTGRPYGVVFIDVDRFKVLNDGLGHSAGDELLRQVANRLTSAARPGDTVARFGGDEFVLLMEGLGSEADVDAIAARFVDALAPVFRIGRHEVRVGVSGGIVVVDGPIDGRDVLSEADAAMYLAKRRGRGRFERFGADMGRAAADRLRVEEDLHRAFATGGELVPFFQTEVDLASGRVVGVEALCRWHHPTGGLVFPDSFVRVVEEMGAAHQLGDRMRAEALSQLVRWRSRRALVDGWVSVNVSASELLRPDFATRVLDDLTAHDLPGSALCLEITESALVLDPEAAVGTVNALRRQGVTFAVDDFGTGYASLAYLRRFTPEFVKIDRSFVDGMLDDRGERAIVRSAIEMAHAFGALAVAEGVETSAHHEALVELGCDLAQGYLYSRPRPAAAVELDGAAALVANAAGLAG